MAEGERRGTRTGVRLLLSWAAVIAVSLLLPADLLPMTLPAGGESSLDQVGHVFLFFVLALLAVGPARARSRHPLLVVLFTSIVYGGLLEILQGVLGWRSAELADWVADGVGTAAGVAASLWWRPT